MAGISGAGSSLVAGTNVPPVSFPGIASGIDYNSIIQKLTNLTLLPVQNYNNQITQINAKNSELIKISGLLNSVQNSLAALSNPSTFNAYAGISSDSTVVTAVSNGNGTPAPGSYLITSTQLATASSIIAASVGTGHALSDNLTNDTINPLNNGKAGDTVPLIESFAAITPTNGGLQRGQITIDGVSVSYDVKSDSLQTILLNVNNALASVDPGFKATYDPTTDSVKFASTAKPVSIGAPSDRGNLLSVLKLDVAPVNNTASSGSVQSAGPVGGINQATVLTGLNYAGLVTNITGGDGSFFTINGQKIVINPSLDNVAAIVKRINASSAGVVASFDTTSNRITLTSKTTGPSGIVLGSTATGDSSNFLSAVGLTPASGATSNIGTQAKITVQNPSGSTSTYYSNTNAITAAIPGLTLNVFKNTSTPTTVTVSADTSPVLSAINTFVSAYNSAINEINIATATPVVKVRNAANSPTATTASSSVVAGGGTLYGDFQIETIKNRLVSIAQQIVRNGSTSYQSLGSIGLSLDSSHQVLQSSDPNAPGGSTSPVSIKQASGTSGAFLPLDLTKFNAAFAANPSAVAAIFSGANGFINDPQRGLGAYLTTVTGLPTAGANGFLGKIPITSLLQNDENSNSAQIKSLQDFVAQLQDHANAQADALRRQFSATEGLIAQYQGVQAQIGQLNQKF
ncbi:MAG: flagellar filament capping protein FliD [Candidatus Velthaea sp.]